MTADSLVAISMNSFLNKLRQSYTGKVVNKDTISDCADHEPVKTLHQSQGSSRVLIAKIPARRGLDQKSSLHDIVLGNTSRNLNICLTF
jgi:hypothetical protein